MARGPNPRSGPGPGATAADRVAALVKEGRHAEAIAQARRALKKAPADPALNRLLAESLLSTGESEQALFAAERAGDDAESLAFAARALRALKRPDEAVERAERAAGLAPDSPDALATFASCLGAAGKPEAALDASRRALELDPNTPSRTLTLVGALLQSARPREAADLLGNLARAHPTDPGVLAAAASVLNYDDRPSASQVTAAHAAFGRALERATPDLGTRITDPDPDRPLRVGFVARELYRHSISYFLEPLLLGLHDHPVETVTYSLGSIRDDYTDRIRDASDVWRDLSSATGKPLLDTIRRDKCDVLVELMGLGVGARLSLLAARPSPVLVTYLSYPNTLGLSRFDARVVDAITDPPGSEPLATEPLVRLPGCFLCYEPDPRAPDVQPRGEGAPFVFVSFNTVQKINPTTLDLWARALAAAPGSSLLLKHPGAGEEATRTHIEQELTTRGAAPNSFELVGHVKGVAEHLAHYHRADLALDTFPYHGTTTTCEAAWMGVPTLTLVGERHASRVGASINAALGLDDLVADTPEAFVETAARLAADPGDLRARRVGLRESMRSSPLMDRAAHAAAFASALRAIWRDACAKA